MYAQQYVPKKGNRVVRTIVLAVAIGLSLSFSIYMGGAHSRAKTHVDKSASYYHVGRYAEAAAEARKAISIDYDYPRAHNFLGYDLYKLGQLTEGIAEVRIAVKQAPGYQSAHDNLGYMLYEQGDLAGSRHEFDKALAIDPKDVDAKAEIGRILARQGNIKDALTAANEAVALDPDAAVVRRCLGFVLYQSGDKVGAKREWLKCIEIGNKDVADQARAYLKQYDL